ncbi:Hypothetical protein NTJ_11150 [Nesidiocoris tenuis]|uniref:Uncharacterized protein n=1 Tax=Nesidiocoris tenuis TaxID=355587 RepID=A0ABN7B1P7_9HEMI|nr:Hypothetical protein NTJ_11150 [Nesidiocoris tenuis]
MKVQCLLPYRLKVSAVLGQRQFENRHLALKKSSKPNQHILNWAYKITPNNSYGRYCAGKASADKMTESSSAFIAVTHRQRFLSRKRPSQVDRLSRQPKQTSADLEDLKGQIDLFYGPSPMRKLREDRWNGVCIKPESA